MSDGFEALETEHLELGPSTRWITAAGIRRRPGRQRLMLPLCRPPCASPPTAIEQGRQDASSWLETSAQITRIGRRRITRSWTTLANARRACGVAAAGLVREAGMTEQAVLELVPERPAAGVKLAEPGADGDEALVAEELLVEEVSIDGMCGVY
jgi:mycofactocin precursor